MRRRLHRSTEALEPSVRARASELPLGGGFALAVATALVLGACGGNGDGGGSDDLGLPDTLTDAQLDSDAVFGPDADAQLDPDALLDADADAPELGPDVLEELGAAPFTARVSWDRTIGVVGQTFTLSVAIDHSGLDEPLSFAWDFEGGTSADAADSLTQRVTFADPGDYLVELVATNAAGDEYRSGAYLRVYDADATFALGDIDDDGDLDSDDTDAIRASLAALAAAGTLVDPDLGLAADVDLDEQVDQHDLELLDAAVLAGAAAPRYLDRESGARGAVLRLIHPALLDPEAEVTVRFGDADPEPLSRGLPGYAVTWVPLDLDEAATIDIALLVDGTAADSFPFEVLAPSAPDAPPGDTLLGAMDDSELLLESLPALLDEWTSYYGATEDESLLLQTLVAETASAAAELNDDFRAAFAYLPDDARALWEELAFANGLDQTLLDIDEAFAELAALELPTGVGVDASARIISLICTGRTILEVAKVISYYNEWVGLILGYLNNPLTQIAFPLAAQIIGVLQQASEFVGVVMDVFQIAMGFLPHLDDQLRVTPASEDVALGASTTFTVVASLRIARGLCEGTLGSSYIVGKLKDLLTRRIGSWVPGFDNAMRAARYQRDELDWFYQRVYDSISFLVSRIAEISRAEEAFGWLASRVCRALIGEGGTLVDPDLELSPAETIRDASCFFPESDGSYTCEDECADENVTITARATFCGDIEAEGSADVLCLGCRNTCDTGCCDGQTCVPFESQDDDRCGAAYAACGACLDRQACIDGECVCQSTCTSEEAAAEALRCNGATVSQRCEAVEPGCYRWRARTDCADYGATCDETSGACVGGCGPHNCELGCCQVDGEERTCLAAADAQSDTACGFDGATCRACTEDEECAGGVCRCRTPGGCDPIPPAGGGRSWGEPHLITHDGGVFDFQGLGDYVLARATDESDDFVLQTRHRAFSGSCDGLAINGAIALRWRGQIVELDYELPDSVVIDATTVPLESGDSVFLAEGLSVARYGSDYYTVSVADGPELYLANRGRYFDVSIRLPADYAGAVEGLLGDFDGDASDDRRAFGGAPITGVLTEEDSDAAAETWHTVAGPADHPLVGLFSTSRPADAPHTERCRLADLDSAARDAARATCEAAGVTDPALLAICTFDVAFGDDDFAGGYAELSGSYELLPVARPLDLGPDHFSAVPSGSWAYLVDSTPSDGAFVTFSGADGLSFFVSDEGFGDATFVGTIQFPEPAFDDNYGGLVFGYEGPDGSLDERITTYLVAFNGHPSSYPDGSTESPDGVALVSVDGVFSDLEPGFWGQESSDAYAVWDSRFGDGQGWTGGPPDPEDGHVGLFTYEYVLVAHSDRISLTLEATPGDSGNPRYDGSVVFELTPDEVGLSEFRTGRFGFYGLHQPIFATYRAYVAEE